MKTSSVKRVVQVSVCFGLLVGGFGAWADWFGPTVDWKWSTAGNWGDGSVPTLSTEVDLNNDKITETNPLLISDGCAAECAVLRLASNWAVADGRVPAVKLCSGGSLRTGRGVVLSTQTDGKSLLILDGGTLINDHATPNTDRIGFSGQGTVRQDRGTYRFDGSNGAAYLQLGVYSGSVGTYIMNGGQIERVNDASRSSRIYVGVEGKATFRLNDGEIDCPMVIGSGSGSDGTLEVNGGRVAGNITVGMTNGKGRIVLNGGELDLTEDGNRLRLGYLGEGSLEWNGGAIKNLERLYVGHAASSSGRLVVNTGADQASVSQLYVAGGGDGVVKVADNAVMKTVWAKVGSNTVGGEADVEIGECGSLVVGERLELGGFIYKNPDDLSQSETWDWIGRGSLTLKGGDLKLLYDTGSGSVKLYVGRQQNGESRFTGAEGTIRGWGRIMGATYADNTVRMQMGLGRIVGDGFGEERLLDLTPVINIANEVTNPADGTTGWYAENKGAVHYPRIWFGGGSVARYCFGTDKNAGEPDFVNSMKFSVTTSTAGHFRGGLYAADRMDLLLDKLPPHSGVVNVWKLGVFDSTVDGNPVPFSGLSLKIRYDQTKVASADKLALYRYAGGRWTKVGKTTVAESAATHTISTTKAMDSDAAQTYNAGIIALVKDVSGLSVLVR